MFFRALRHCARAFATVVVAACPLVRLRLGNVDWTLTALVIIGLVVGACQISTTHDQAGDAVRPSDGGPLCTSLTSDADPPALRIPRLGEHTGDEDLFCGASAWDACECDKDCDRVGCSLEVCANRGWGTWCWYFDCFDPDLYGTSCRCVNGTCGWWPVSDNE